MFGLVYAPALADFYVTLAADEAVNARLEPESNARGLADCRLQPLHAACPIRTRWWR